MVTNTTLAKKREKSEQEELLGVSIEIKKLIGWWFWLI